MSRREKEKEMRRNTILDAAEELFFQKGFNHVSMDEIAKKADFTKRTVYQYFINKEDLYFGVAHRGFKKMFLYTQREGKKGKTGFEIMRYSLLGYHQFCQENPEVFRLMNYIGYIKKKNSPEEQEWMKFDDTMFQQMTALIEMGIKDGSMRDDLDPQKTAFAMAFITTGFFNQFAETGTTFTTHFTLDENQFCQFSLDLILDSLKKK